MVKVEDLIEGKVKFSLSFFCVSLLFFQNIFVYFNVICQNQGRGGNYGNKAPTNTQGGQYKSLIRFFNLKIFVDRILPFIMKGGKDLEQAYSGP